MPSPFPGMDPYLEDPELWPDVHHGLISGMQTALNPTLVPRYVARVELRVYVSDQDDPGRDRVPDVRIEKVPRRKGAKKAKPTEALAVAEPLSIPFLPDEEIEEARLEIRHRESKALVTVIEVLSPSNKIRGSAGRRSFLDKRREILSSEVHWVEIDLLRAGTPTLARLARADCDYRIVVARCQESTYGKFWPVSVRQALPVISVPLRGKDADVPLDLGAVLRAAYDNAAYDVSIDYRRDPVPPLSRDNAAWAAKLLREQGLR
ncbi:MAG TPA: DUF4058 family protein [Gemmataceae bacterium]|nr:DUF4058 family protein [Gemmataceae bacterium]